MNIKKPAQITLKLTKIILFGATVLICSVFVMWVLLWIQLFVVFPPEHVYLSAESPNGRQVALFSIKYQGIHPWLPSDIEPHAYITVIETRHGSKLVRQEAYHGTVKNSFMELARQYAPWATDQVMSLKWVTTP
jgi:hypothetical protein